MELSWSLNPNRMSQTEFGHRNPFSPFAPVKERALNSDWLAGVTSWVVPLVGIWFGVFEGLSDSRDDLRLPKGVSGTPPRLVGAAHLRGDARTARAGHEREL